MEELLWTAALWPVTACAVHGRELVSSRRRVGVVLHSEPAPAAASALYVCLGAVLCALTSGALPALPSCALVALSAAAVVLARSQRGQVCGDAGVRSGCFSYAYEDLEEWRLTGDHLRFRVGEVWRAVSLPVPLHPGVRELLENRAGGLESRFSR